MMYEMRDDIPDVRFVRGGDLQHRRVKPQITGKAMVTPRRATIQIKHPKEVA